MMLGVIVSCFDRSEGQRPPLCMACCSALLADSFSADSGKHSSTDARGGPHAGGGGGRGGSVVTRRLTNTSSYKVATDDACHTIGEHAFPDRVAPTE